MRVLCSLNSNLMERNSMLNDFYSSNTIHLKNKVANALSHKLRSLVKMSIQVACLGVLNSHITVVHSLDPLVSHVRTLVLIPLQTLSSKKDNCFQVLPMESLVYELYCGGFGWSLWH